MFLGQAYLTLDTITSQVIETAVFIDTPDTTHKLGDGYEGLIYQLCVYQYKKDEFTLIDPLPNDCKYNEVSETCEECPEGCDACIRPTDCRNCVDPLCLECATYDTCATCIEGAELVDGVCSCQDGNQYFTDIDACSVCIDDCKKCTTSTTCDVCEDGSFLNAEDTCSDCHTSCETCTGSSDEECATCAEGTALLPDANVCSQFCPSGYEPTHGECVLVGEASTCFSFPEKEMNQTLNGIAISQGDTIANSAKPIMNRGLYFDGDDILVASNVAFNTKFTVEFWIRPESDGNLMAVKEGYLVMKLSNGMKAAITLESEDAENTTSLKQEWTNIAYQFDNKSLNFLINGAVSSTATFNQLVLDSTEFSHIIGMGYTGFLYKLCLHNIPNASPEITNPACVPDFDCVNCPDDTCVSECLHTQFIQEDSSCGECQEDCVNGCVRGTDCRNCSQELCAECSEYDSCVQCISGALPVDEAQPCECPPEKPYDRNNDKCGECHIGCDVCTTDGELRCIECDPGFYHVSDALEASEMCQPCAPECALCTDSSRESCSACTLGYFLIPGTTVCADYCPSALEKGSDHTCLETPEKEVCFVFDDKPIERTVSGVSISVAEPEPLSVYERGIYFDGTAQLELNNLILNTQFTLEFIIKSQVPGGKMLNVETSLSQLFLSTDINNSQWGFTWKDDSHRHGAYEVTLWYNFAVAVTRADGQSTVQLYINNAAVGQPLTLDSLIIDSPDNLHTFGTGFNGLLYRMCVYQYVKTNFVLDDLSNCDLDEIPQDDGSCLPCNEGCEEGCIRQTDCRPCEDFLCGSCPASFSGPCDPDGCIEGAVWEDGVCACKDPNYYQVDIDICDVCQNDVCAQCDVSTECIVCIESYYLGDGNQCYPCDPRCKTCENETNENCEECNNGYYKQPGTNTCESYCPNGFVPEDGVCKDPEDSSSLDYCFVFEDSLEQLNGDITVGVTSIADADPKLMDSRGLYFDSDDALQMNGILINRSFTLEFWIRPYVEEAPSADLFNIASEGVTKFILSQSSNSSFAGLLHEDFSAISNVALAREWTHVAYVINAGTDVSIYINGNVENFALTDLIIGQEETTHLIGQSYIGFLYSLCLRQRVFTEFDIDTSVPDCPTPVNCAFCPISTCLSNCEYDQFLDSDQCGDCLDSCTEGCVRGTDCRPCTDELCEICPDIDVCEQCLPGAQNPEQCECQTDLQYDSSVGACVPCSDNCISCEYGTLICQECEVGWYLDEASSCQQCNLSCAECSSGDNKSCSRCREDFYLIPNTSQCEPWCPSGLTDIDQVCKETPLATICFNWTDKQVALTDDASGVQVLYETQDESSPKAVYERGIYFEGTRLVLPDLILNTIVTLEFVVRPESAGELLSITKPDLESFLRFELTTEAIRFNYIPNISIEDGSWQLQTWHNVAITVELTQVTLYLDNVKVGSSVVRSEIAVDSLENNHSIAQNYTGFMYKFCVYQFAKFAFDITTPPSNCDLDQAGPNCQDCLEECSDGCVHADSCSPCVDKLCLLCDSWYADCKDDGCIENATTNDEGDCECTSPYIYLDSLASCEICVTGCELCTDLESCEICQKGYFLNEEKTCTLCNENCADCTNETQNCAVCSEGSIHMPDTQLCAPGCPSGYTQVDEVCTLVQSKHCFVFDNKQIELTSGDVSISLTGSDPKPMYNRGIFFDGDDTLDLSDLVFNTEFTLEFWLRPYVDPENNGTLLHVSGGMDLIFGLSQNAPGIQYLTSHYSSTILTKEWAHVRYSINKSLLNIYVNDLHLTSDNSVSIMKTIIDQTSNNHTIGNSYVGFIYKICITQEILDISDIDPSSDCGANGCTNCPIDTCVSSCDHTQYVDTESDTCGECEEGCDTGCMRSTDCRNCLEQKCDFCSVYETCDNCIETAEKDGEGGCQCRLDTIYSCESKKCGQCNDNCEECTPCELDCTLCEQGYFIDDNQSCSICVEACAVCEDGTNENCSECSEGYFKFPNTDMCQDYCPTKLPNSDNECLEEDASICISFDDKNIRKSEAESGVTVVLDDAPENQPISVHQRGIYFTSQAEMRLSDLVLNTRFTLEFIIRPETSGSLFTIVESDDAHVLTFAFTADSLSLQVYNTSVMVDFNSHETKWYNLAVAVDLMTVRFYADGVAYDPVETLQSLVIDTMGNSHIFGREYQGYLYTICVHQYLHIAFETPSYSMCELDQTADDPCQDCLDKCNQGCIRSTDCRKCDDPLCENCPAYDGSCDDTGCIEGASQVDGVCTCTLPMFYLIDIDKCQECLEGCETCTATDNCPTCLDKYFKDGDICTACSPNCANCSGPEVDQCTECIEGTYFLPDVTRCEPACPSGYEPQGMDCVPAEPQPDAQEFCFVFTNKDDVQQNSNGVEVACVENQDHLKPKPMLNRGIYFDGEDRMNFLNLILNTVTTLDYWIKPETAGWLMSIELESEAAIFLLSDITSDGATMRVPAFNSVTNQTGFLDVANTWTHLQYRLNNYSIQFFVNGIESAVNGQERETLLIDKVEYPHTLGQGYAGFIYSICIRNYAATSNDIDPNPECSDFECTSCPIGVCLSECAND